MKEKHEIETGTTRNIPCTAALPKPTSLKNNGKYLTLAPLPSEEINDDANRTYGIMNFLSLDTTGVEESPVVPSASVVGGVSVMHTTVVLSL